MNGAVILKDCHQYPFDFSEGQLCPIGGNPKTDQTQDCASSILDTMLHE